MTPLYIIWQASPYIFSIGNFSLGWYGFLFMLGFTLSYLFMYYIFKTEGKKIALLDILTIYIFLAVLIGSRLGHVFFYEWEYYQHHLVEILMVWKGGLASHGGTLMIIVALFIFWYRYRVNMAWLFDRLCIVIPVTAALIRMGNLMNSEIYGTPTRLPWGFVFAENPAAGLIPRHPTQIYEALVYLSVSVLLYLLWRRDPSKNQHGFFTGLLLIIIFAARFIIEFIKTDQMPFEQSMTLNMGQWLSVPFIVAGAGLLVYAARKKKSRTDCPGIS